MGATVALVEPPDGSPWRAIGPYLKSSDARERSVAFRHYNTNKRSIVIDPTTPAGRSRLQDLVDAADILIDGRPLPAKSTPPANPGLIHISITPFGSSGPRRALRGSDLIAQASGGMAFINGFADTAPLQGFGPQAYHSGGLHGAIAALLALLHRQRSGLGQLVDVSLQECVANCVEHASSIFHHEGRVAERQGALHWTRYFRTGRCRDGHVMHCTLGDWTTLSEWVKASGKGDALNDPLFDDPDYRKRECERLFDVLDGWALDLDANDLVGTAQLLRLPFAIVEPPERILTNEQLIGRAYFVDSPSEDGGQSLRHPGAPYVFNSSPWTLRQAAPKLDQDRDLSWEPRGSVSVIAPGHVEPTARALDGIRVLDFTWVVAGPLCTRILGDHGAEVIKIERHNATDFGSRRGGLTGNLNRGKHSLVLNMATPRGVALARDLAARCDVVVDNFSARVMKNWGLDYDSLRTIKPDIIALSMSGFGHSGPHRDHVSYGPTLQALSGHTHLMRHPGRQLAGWGFSYSDMSGGCTGALAVLLALWHRRNSGEGQFIDLSQFESLVSLTGPSLLALLNGGIPTIEAVGNRSQEAPAAPHGIYRCADESQAGLPADRWCAIAVFSDDEWHRLRQAMGDPAWTNESRFATLEERLRHQNELDACMESWTRHHAAPELMERLQAAGVTAAVVAHAADLCRDEHLQARGYWQRVVTPENETLEFDGQPYRMSASPGRVTGAGPLLGEHTDQILQRTLGLSPTDCTSLRSDGVVA